MMMMFKGFRNGPDRDIHFSARCYLESLCRLSPIASDIYSY